MIKISSKYIFISVSVILFLYISTFASVNYDFLNEGENDNLLGYIGNNYTLTGLTDNYGRIGYIGNKYNDQSLDVYKGQIGYIGNNYTLTGLTDNYGRIGYIGNKYDDQFLDIYKGQIGYIGNTFSLNGVSTFSSNIIGYLKNNSKLVIIDLNNSHENNSNIVTSYNVNSGPTLLASSNSYYKLKETELMCSISEETSAGDPVTLSTGDFDYENTLMSYNSEGLPFQFNVKYRNQAYYNGPLGNNFDFNYNIYLTEDEEGNINYHDGKLGAFRFVKTSTGFAYNDTINAKLTMSGLNYIINFDDKKTYKFGLNSKIQSIKDAFGNEISFLYNENNELTKITDSLSRQYNVSYYEHSRIKDIEDFVGNKVTFTYFGTGSNDGSQYDLEKITMTNSGVTREIGFTYTIGDDFESSHNIVKLIDSEGSIYVENTYDDYDRVLTQKYGNGTIYYDYTMDENNKYIAKNSITDREGNVIDYYYNSKGNTIKKVIKKQSGDLEYNYVYDDKGNLIKEIKTLGNGTEYNYDENNNVIETRQKQNISSTGSRNDIVSTSIYDLTFNKPIQTILPNGLIINYTYDTNGNLLKKETVGVKDYSGSGILLRETYAYNNKGQLTKQTNARGLETTFEYLSGNLLKITKGTGSSKIEQAFEYDKKGNLVKTKDARGNEITLTYDEFNLVIKQLTAEGIEANTTYNNLNKKTNEEIILGGGEKLETTYEYDILDNITKAIQDISTTKTLEINKTYDTNSRVIEEQTGSGAKVSYTYDENGLITKKKIQSQDKGNIETSYNYDLNGRLISETNPRGKVINYEYDLFDRLIKKINPDGTNERYEYDEVGNITKVEKYTSNNALLSKEENIYDKRGKVITNKKYLQEESKVLTSYFKYDENGNLTKSIDSKGNTTIYTYDEFDRNIETTEAKGNKVINTYDKNNNVIQKQVVESNGKTTTTSYTYDKDNRLTSETNSLGKTKTYTYNKLNQVVSITDEEGNITNYSYNYVGKVKSSSQSHLPEGEGAIVTSYSYDERGNMLSVTDANGNTTTYEYNDLNQLTKQTYADGKYVSYSYDKNGNISSKTDPNGTTVGYIYDDLDRLITKNIQTGSGVEGVINETYTYDQLGRLTQGNDSNNHKLEFSYDSLNRLTSENQSGSLVNYTYDDNGNLTSITSPSNKVTSYSYDELDRITNINNGNENIANYNYTGLENTSITYGNGKVISKTYDELSRLSSLNNGIKNYSYNYDDVNNITSDNYKNYTYDSLYRLTNVKDTNQAELESFAYDDVGNRLNNYNSKIGSGASYDYTTNNLNQYTSLSGSISKYVIEEIIEEIETGSGSESGSGETNSGTTNTGSTSTGTTITYSGGLVNIDDSNTFTYDNNGNIVSNGKYGFIYDYKNRIVRVENGSGTIAEYGYDVLDRRYRKETQEKVIDYFYSNENILSESASSSGVTTTKDYINGLGTDDLVAYELDGNRYYFSKNNLGSVDGITDSSGNVVVSYEYDSYGNVTQSGADIGNTRLFTSREYDSEIGLYYFRARYYDSELGRFISRDPIDIADDVNLYGYTKNNPLNYNDPSGKEKKAIVNKLRSFGNKFISEAINGKRKKEYKNELINNGMSLLSIADNFEKQYDFTYNSRISNKALSYWLNNDSSFSYNGEVESDFYRTIGDGEYKCSTYVGSVLEKSLGYKNDSDYSFFNLGYNYVTANDWAYSDVDSFENIEYNDAKMGDIISFGDESDLGHVGIYLGDNLYISARQGDWYSGPKFNWLDNFQGSDGIMIKDINFESGNFKFKRYTP